MSNLVVGAGIGGLSLAALLANAGEEVTVLEKNSLPGGRARVYRENGYSFDMGPSWYLMPDIYESFFRELGFEINDCYELVRLDPSYRIFFKNGEIMDVSANIEENYKLFNKFEENGGGKLENYLEKAARDYRIAVDSLLIRDYDQLRSLFDVNLIREGLKLPLFGNIDDYISGIFSSARAKRILEYSIGFIGGSPRNTPALYYIMNHVDLNLGVWYPADGGISRVVDALVELGKENGVEYRYNSEVTGLEVKNRKVEKVNVGDEIIEPDLLVVNADYPHTEINLLDKRHQSYDERYWDSRVIAPSALVLYIGLEKKLEKLDHHNLFLTKDWDQGFESVFNPEKAEWPETPSYYINVTSKTDPTVAPKGGETIFVLVPLAPDLTDTPELREKYYQKLVSHIEVLTEESIIGNEVVKRIYCVNDYREDYNAYKGTALGLTHTLRQTALFRPSHKSSKVDNLYYTGHYTHPGIGMPMCLISSQVLAKTIEKRHGGP